MHEMYVAWSHQQDGSNNRSELFCYVIKPEASKQQNIAIINWSTGSNEAEDIVEDCGCEFIDADDVGEVDACIILS